MHGILPPGLPPLLANRFEPERLLREGFVTSSWLARDLETGKRKWKRKLGSLSASTPALEDGRVYVTILETSKGGAGRVAGDRRHLRSAGQQQVDDLTPDGSARSGDEDHGAPFMCTDGTPMITRRDRPRPPSEWRRNRPPPESGRPFLRRVRPWTRPAVRGDGLASIFYVANWRFIAQHQG